MKRITRKQFDAVIKLDGPARYKYFIKWVADWEIAWGLWDKGWALMADDDGEQSFPLWPAREYAAALCTDEWKSYEPSEIPLAELLDELLPKLAARKIVPSIFPTPSGKSVKPTIAQLEGDLRTELASSYGE